MNEIITIVIIAAAIIFKIVGKKLDSAGGDEVFPTIPVDPDMKMDSDIMGDPGCVDELVIEEAEPVLPVTPVAKEPIVKSVKSVAPVEVKSGRPILEEEQPKQKEKINLKKLIVYSEIMKPKYNE